MKNMYRRTWLVAMVMSLLIILSACESTGQNQVQQDQQTLNNQTNNLHKAQPFPPLSNSAELANIVERYKRLNDPNHISYIYIFIPGYGMEEFQVKGKCTSTESLYNAPAVASRDNGYTGGAPVTLPNSQPDGSYGSNEVALYCFLYDRQKTMIEIPQFSGAFYQFQDQRLPLTFQRYISYVSDGK